MLNTTTKGRIIGFLAVLYSIILRLKDTREKEKVEENQIVIDNVIVSFREIV